MENKLTVKQAMGIIKEWYPTNSISIDISYWHYSHSGEDKLNYSVYIDTPIRTSVRGDTLEKLVTALRPVSMTIDEQLDALEDELVLA